MAVCEFGILTGLLLHTKLQKFLAIREFGGESRGNKAGFYCTRKLHYMDLGLVKGQIEL